MRQIDVLVNKRNAGLLFFGKDENKYGFNYIKKSPPISLIMPYRKSTYNWKSKLHPIFDMNIPEGYLFELFKNILSKEHGYVDDVLYDDSPDTFTMLLNSFLKKNSI